MLTIKQTITVTRLNINKNHQKEHLNTVSPKYWFFYLLDRTTFILHVFF